MKRATTVFMLSLLTFSDAEAAIPKNEDVDCRVVVGNDRFVAYFPIKNPSQAAWAWNAKEGDAFSYDYTWTAEPGYIDRNNIFIEGDYGFGLAHWNHGDFKDEASGSMGDLIRDAGERGSVYLNSQDKIKRAEASKRLRLWEIPVQSTYRESAVLIASRSMKARKLLFLKKPTHIKMTVATNLSAFLWVRRLNNALSARLHKSLSEQDSKLVHR